MPNIFFLNQKGQTTLVIVVMVLAASLVVGIAASNRAVSNIRRTTNISQSDQAYACAESGAESALNKINEDLAAARDPKTTDSVKETLKDTDNVDICYYEYTITDLASGDNILLDRVSQDDSQEIDLRGYSGTINISFDKSDSDSADVALELTFIKGNSAPYTVEKRAFDCGTLIDSFDTGDGHGSTGYACGTGDIDISNDTQVLRVRPLFAAAKLSIDFSDAPPSQGYSILSIGTAGGAVRKIEVKRTKSQLPAVFDYAIFSEGDLYK